MKPFHVLPAMMQVSVASNSDIISVTKYASSLKKQLLYCAEGKVTMVKTFTSITVGDVDTKELANIIWEIQNGDDRTCAIVGGAFIDDALRKCLICKSPFEKEL